MFDFLEGKAIIFDLDGVLVDSADCHYRAWKMIADKLGVDFDHEKNHLIRGVSRRESLMIIIDGQITLEEDAILELMEEKNNIYQNLISKSAKKLLLPGVIEFLEDLRKTPLKLAIASGSKNALALIDLVGLDKNCFDVIISGKDFKKTKPDPEAFFMAAESLNIEPENCLVIEDAPAGIDAAKKAGMGTFGIGKAYLGSCDIRSFSIAEAGVEAVFNYFAEI